MQKDKLKLSQTKDHLADFTFVDKKGRYTPGI